MFYTNQILKQAALEQAAIEQAIMEQVMFKQAVLESIYEHMLQQQFVKRAFMGDPAMTGYADALGAAAHAGVNPEEIARAIDVVEGTVNGGAIREATEAAHANPIMERLNAIEDWMKKVSEAVNAQKIKEIARNNRGWLLPAAIGLGGIGLGAGIGYAAAPKSIWDEWF